MLFFLFENCAGATRLQIKKNDRMKFEPKSSLLGFMFILPLVHATGSKLLPLEDARQQIKSSSLDSKDLPRIVGGSAAATNQFPHQVALLRSGVSLTCGGSLIRNKWVLTAAHCVYSGSQVIQPSQIIVLAGTINLNRGGIRRDIERIIPHERYGNFQNDIALLELKRSYLPSSSIRTIPLARSEVPAGSAIIISGWGRLYANGPLPNVLQYNQVTAISARDCAAQTGINAGLLCFQSPVNNGACNGDSGGPAVYNNQLVGVANFVINYCGSGAPDGYAKVSDFVRWIESKVN